MTYKNHNLYDLKVTYSHPQNSTLHLYAEHTNLSQDEVINFVFDVYALTLLSSKISFHRPTHTGV